ncbi:MAG: nucleoside-diphosphate sugar epimerase/dehydratase [Desulfuromonadaceae bacterium]|nr:nucleoside-diphosphate sugar epimerase/dehydratase [Desulfuromonadaceae bacterium]
MLKHVFIQRLLTFTINLCAIAVALVLAFLVRYDFRLEMFPMQAFWRLLPAVLAIKIAVFWYYGLFRGWWRYVSMADLIAISKANVLSSALVVMYAAFAFRLESIARTVLFLDGLFCFLLIAGMRFLIRVIRERSPRLREGKSRKTRMLIVGAGDAGQMIVRELRVNRKLPYYAIGFVDDDTRKQKNKFLGLPVLGTCADIPKLCRKHRIEEVVIAIPSASGKRLKSIVEQCHNARVKFKTLPSVGGLIDGSVLIEQIKEVSLEDLLGRAPVRLDTENISAYLRGKRVLITGAGGSIGSELCRQVVRFNPAKLVLFENGETPLFSIEQELRQRFPKLRIFPIVGDIRYRARVEAIFDEFMPEVVFHAAAYKHVPMMEVNPAEAVNNNVRGTQIVAEAAHMFRVERFVMVSTDKAVNPTNIMGTTKRAAEKIVQALARRSRTRFVTVRFGNVLGSNGSVIPTFQKQIYKGGPITVTHKDITRFFMTIPEAAQLVLQAGSMGAGGEIYLLDMGEPVKILHLAEELIRLSGKEPYEDIDIVFTGLRPGEKLYEELLLDGEGVKPTTHEKICVARSIQEDEEILREQLEELFVTARKLDLARTVALLHEIVPEYQPAKQWAESARRA